MPGLPVIAEPPLEPCTLIDIFESLKTPSGPIAAVNTNKAMRIAQAQHSTGVDNETCDFDLLLKSNHTQGWRLPANLIEK